MSVRERLEKAIGTGEIIGIVYHAGSQPGAFRDIAPIQIDGEKIRARCYMSGAVKTFVIDKIELRGDTPTPEDRANGWKPNHVHTVKFKTIDEIHAALLTELQALGWHIARNADEEGERVDLRAHFKNGKLRAGPDVCLIFQRIAFAIVATEDGDLVREEQGPRTRPWIVRSKNFNAAKTYSDGDIAANLFLTEARKLAPSQPA